MKKTLYWRSGLFLLTLLFTLWMVQTSFADIASGTSNTCSWKIDDAGQLSIYPTDGSTECTLGGPYSSYVYLDKTTGAPWTYYASTKIKSFFIDPAHTVKTGTSADYLFSQFEKCTDWAGLEYVDVSASESFVKTFLNSDGLSDLTLLSGWDVSAGKYFIATFEGCDGLTNLNGLQSWDVSQATGLSGENGLEAMFAACRYLTDLTALSGWDVSTVKDFTEMFYECISLESLNGLQNWDVSSARELMYMFEGCTKLTDLSALNAWKDKLGTNASKTNMSNMFTDCSSLKNLSPLADWPLQVIDGMFQGCSSLTDLSPLQNWDLSNVTKIPSLFSNCSSLADLTPISGWDVSGMTAMGQLFAGCTALKDLTPISGWDVSGLNGRALDLYQTFYGCTGLTDLSPLKDWDVSGATWYLDEVFTGCINVKTADLSGWEINDTKPDYMFGNMTAAVRLNYYYTNMNPVKLYVLDKHSYKDFTATDLTADPANLVFEPCAVSVSFSGGSGTSTLTADTYADAAAFYTAVAGLSDAPSYDAAKKYYTAGSDVALTVTPDAGAHIISVTATDEDGAVTTLSEPYQLSDIQKNYTVEAELGYVVAYADGGAASGTFPAAQAVKTGDTVTVEANSGNLAKTGHTFTGWQSSADGNLYQAGQTFAMPAADVTLTAQYSVNSYVLKYDADNGATLPQQNVTYGGTVTVNSGSEKTGYTFTGWKNSYDGNIYQPGGTFAMPASDVTLTAQYTINSYSLKHVADGTTLSETSVTYGDNVTVGVGPEKTGHTFTGWQNSADGKIYQAGQTFLMPASDVTLTAQYSVNSYVLKYDADNGVTLPQQNVTYGDTVTVNSGSEKTGYTFTGWKNSYDGNLYQPGQTFAMPASDVTLTAQYTINSYSLKYDADGTILSETSVAYGTAVTVGAETSKTGHTFTGWQSSADGNLYQAGQTFAMPAADVTLTAQYSVNSYVLKYDADNGATLPQQNVAYGEMVTVNSGSEKTGYTFTGWKNSYDGNLYQPGQTFAMPASDVTLTAQYTINSYSLKHVADGTTLSETSVTYGDNVTVGVGPEKTGHTFTGWQNSADGNVYQAGQIFAMPAEDVTLTALFDANVHTLTYTAAEATAGTVPAAQSVAYGTEVSVADGSGLSLTDYVFAYWTDGENQYKSGDTFTMPDADVTLEAIFSSDYYIVVFTTGSAQRGTAPDPIKVLVGESVILPENIGQLEKTGYTFEGWTDGNKLYKPGQRYELNLVSKGLLGVIEVTMDPVFERNNEEIPFYPLPGAFEGITAMPGTGFSALRPTTLREQPASLAYHTTVMELMLPVQSVSAAVQVIPMENGSWAVDWLSGTAGLLEGSALPGEGPCFIAAHNHLNTTEAGPFWGLSQLAVNDRVFIRNTESGELLPYSVYESVQYGAEDFAEMAEKAYRDEAGLVLITCEDESVEGGYIHRRVVFAK